MLLKSYLSIIHVFILIELSFTLIFEEICFHEWFRPQCKGQHEIVLIEEAIYGRIKLGKCLSSEDLLSGDKNNKMFFGCHIDVTSILNRKCFGKSFCEIYVLDEDLIKDGDTRPCFKGLFMYLKVNYRCVINQSYQDKCDISVTSEVKQVMMNLNADKMNVLSKYCGHYLKPWALETSIGQYIEINLIKHDFIRKTNLRSKCHNGGYNIGYLLTDNKLNAKNEIEFNFSNDNNIRKNNITLCINVDKLETSLLNVSTKSSKLELILLREVIPDLKMNEIIGNYLLLQLRAIGCVDLIPPVDAWLKRNNDIATVGCYSTRQTWTLICNGNNWQGVFGNCSMFNSDLLNYRNKNEKIYPDNQSKKKSSSNILFLSIVAICGFGLALCLVIIFIGCVYFKSLNKTNKKKKEKCTHSNYIKNACNYVNGQHSSISNYDVTNDSIYKNDFLNNTATDEAAYFFLEHDNKNERYLN